MIAQLNDIAQIWWQWMAGMFWQVSLFIILITLLDMAIRRWAWPQVRYVLWGLVFLKLIIPPTWQMPTSIVSWIQPKVEKQMPFRIEPRNTITVNSQASVSSTPSPTQITKSVVAIEKASWQAIVLLTWLAGMIAFGMMLIIKMSRLPRRSKKLYEQNAPGWFHDLLVKTAQHLNLKKIPTIIFSKDTKSPAVYGVFKPILLLPEGCLDQLSREQAEYVLMHELCHLKRGDLLVHWFCLILQVIYWFNPLLIWTRRQMRHVCEICCDLSVANLLRERTRDYRDTLLATAKELLAETVEPGLGLLGVFEEPFRLVSRLKWLEKKTWENRKRKFAATICTSLVMVVCVMPMAGLSQQANSGQPDYKLGIEYDQQNRPVAITYPAVFYEAVLVEVDEDKDLDLSAAQDFGAMIIDQTKESNDNYAVRAAFNPGLSSEPKEDGTTDQSSVYDIERVRVLKESPSSNLNGHAPIGSDVSIITSAPKGGGPAVQSIVNLSAYYYDYKESPDIEDGGATPQSPLPGELPSTYPPDPSIDYSTWSSIGMLRGFKDDITLGGSSFPDMETALKTIEHRSASMRSILVPADKKATIKIPALIGEREHTLQIRAKVLENGLVSQKIDLTAYKSTEWQGVSLGINTNGMEIKDGSTMVISCPTFKHAVAEGETADRKKLYIFLTSRVFKTAEDAERYFQANNKVLSTDVFYSDSGSANYTLPNPEYKFGAEFDDAERKKQVKAAKTANPDEQPVQDKIDITAVMMTRDIKTSSAEFAGNAKLSLGSMTINAENFKMFYKENAGAIPEQNLSSILNGIATGNVKIEWKNVIATCEKLSLFPETKIVVLSGSPNILSGSNTISGDVISLNYLKEDIIIENLQASITHQIKNKMSLSSITAKSFQTDRENGDAIWSGNVKLSLGSIMMSTDNFKISTKENTDIGKIYSIESALKADADGNVRIECENSVATCEKASIDPATHTIILSGGPKIAHDGYSISGDVIKFNYETEKWSVDNPLGSKRL